MADRPNILMIMSDEHDPAVMGCYGDPIVQTPHLDGLAERGITFDAAYTSSPVCAPARASFTAAQYVSRCGVWTNDCQLPSDDYPSVPHALNAAGYECWLGGKMHFSSAHRYGFRMFIPAPIRGRNPARAGGGRTTTCRNRVMVGKAGQRRSKPATRRPSWKKIGR